MIRTITSRRTQFVVLHIAVGILLLPTIAFTLDAKRDDVQTFMDDMVKTHGFEREYLKSTLSQGETKQTILDAISRPAEKTKAWHEYRAIFVTPKRINAGGKFWAEHDTRLNRIAADTGVPVEIIVAIIGVETYYGRIRGSYRVLDALTTLGFDYPPRSKFFRSELEQLFLLARDESIDLITMTGSYAGAIGPPQFIPSSYRRYAVDGDGDGRRDLFDNWDDILASVANYFVEHGWRPGEPVVTEGSTEGSMGVPVGENKLKLEDTVSSLADRGLLFQTDLEASTPAQLISLEGDDGPEYWAGFHNFYVITRYNRSTMYALAVYQLAEALAKERRPASQVNVRRSELNPVPCSHAP